MNELKNYKIAGTNDNNEDIVSLPFEGSLFLSNYNEIEFSNGEHLTVKDFKFFIQDFQVFQLINDTWKLIQINLDE